MCFMCSSVFRSIGTRKWTLNMQHRGVVRAMGQYYGNNPKHLKPHPPKIFRSLSFLPPFPLPSSFFSLLCLTLQILFTILNLRLELHHIQKIFFSSSLRASLIYIELILLQLNLQPKLRKELPRGFKIFPLDSPSRGSQLSE